MNLSTIFLQHASVCLDWLLEISTRSVTKVNFARQKKKSKDASRLFLSYIAWKLRRKVSVPKRFINLRRHQKTFQPKKPNRNTSISLSFVGNFKTQRLIVFNLQIFFFIVKRFFPVCLHTLLRPPRPHAQLNPFNTIHYSTQEKLSKMCKEEWTFCFVRSVFLIKILCRF